VERVCYTNSQQPQILRALQAKEIRQTEKEKRSIGIKKVNGAAQQEIINISWPKKLGSPHPQAHQLCYLD